jgi:hypothetical protein
VAALLFGAAVALSVLFLLPPFAGRSGGGGDAAPDPGGAFSGQTHIAGSRAPFFHLPQRFFKKSLSSYGLHGQ